VKDPALRDHIYLNADDFALYLRRPWRETFTEESYTSGLLRNRMMNELFHESVPPILTKTTSRDVLLDREPLAVSRHRLVRDLRAHPDAPSHPARSRQGGLRDAVRGIAPDRVIDNPRKVGFNAPIGDLSTRPIAGLATICSTTRRSSSICAATASKS